MDKDDELILKENGWTIECESPFEIRTENGSFASSEAADIVLQYLKDEAECSLKGHWFCLSFVALSDWSNTNACVYVGYPDRNITLDRIQKMKKEAGVTEEAVLTSCSYLGYMSKVEFQGE